MVNTEFSSQFDVLFQNITSNQAPGLNEWEKSVFLTKAEYQLVNEYFNSRTDGVGGGFDGSQRRQYDFSNLIRVENLFYINTFKDRITDNEKLDRRSKVYLFPLNYYLVVNEILSDSNIQYSVIPLDYMEYQRLMLKPYNLPVKRGAWRMITDKKNCNFCHESYKTDEETHEYIVLEDDDNAEQADYKIMTSWADQKRTLEVTIKVTGDLSSTDLATAMALQVGTIQNTEYSSGSPKRAETLAHTKSSVFKLITNAGWNEANTVYEITLHLQLQNTQDNEYFDDCDDETAIKILQECYQAAKDSGNDYSSGRFGKGMTHLDGMAMCSAPSKFETFKTTSDNTVVGRTFETHVISVPSVEIIGKFNGIPTYQMRFVRKLSPIILEDLDNYGDDMSINGITTKRECELPEETHQEILERAVTLAKIAWQGGTITQAAAQQRNEK